MKRIRRSSKQARRIKVILYLALAIAVLVGAGWIGAVLERRGYEPEQGDLTDRFKGSEPVVYQGQSYKLKPQVSSFLFFGTDQDAGSSSYAGRYRSGGQADFIMLIVADARNKTVRRIEIDRDTMAQINVLGIMGNDLGTSLRQICLSHGYGDGGEQSCQHTVQAVSRLLYGIPIDGYYRLSLDGLPVLNALLGGVTVQVQDDLSHLSPAMTPGATVTLSDEDVELFVRSRRSVGDGTNTSRMRRQREFLNKATELTRLRLAQDAGFIMTFLDSLSPYAVTSMTRGRIINEANQASAYEDLGVLTPEGTHKIGEGGYAEFHVDQDALLKLVLDVYYTPEPETAP